MPPPPFPTCCGPSAGPTCKLPLSIPPFTPRRSCAVWSKWPKMRGTKSTKRQSSNMEKVSPCNVVVCFQNSTQLMIDAMHRFGLSAHSILSKSGPVFLQSSLPFFVERGRRGGATGSAPECTVSAARSVHWCRRPLPLCTAAGTAIVAERTADQVGRRYGWYSARSGVCCGESSQKGMKSFQ
jgi:hypothetical protein